MNQKGFFTLIGICFLLIAAILVKGVQESEKNYSYVTTDFKAEVDLQNIADSALIEAVNKIKNNEVELEKSKPTYSISNRRENQHQIINKTVDGVNIQVFYEYGVFENNVNGNIYRMRRNYKANDVKEDVQVGEPQKGVILISVASRESDILDNTIYRRSLGYFLTDGDEDGIIYFMNND